MENGVETFTDDLHISQQQTEKLIQRVDAELQDYNLVVGNRPDGIPLSQGIIYSGVYSSYRLGCNYCTRTGHTEDKCDFKKQSPTNKRNASDSNIPEGKKTKEGDV